MRLAVISDIHSNFTALKEASDYIKSTDTDGIIFLGDYVSDSPYPQDTMNIIYDLKEKYRCFFVRGNREDYFIEYEKNPSLKWSKCSYTGNLLYTYENLTKKDMDFFKSMPHCERVCIEGLPSITICHGSTKRSGELMFLGSETAKCNLESIEDKYLLCGHTHERGSFEYNGKIQINPGALGQAFETRGYAQMAFLNSDNNQWQAEHVLLPFDYKEEWKRFDSSGLNDYAKYYAKISKAGLKYSHNYLSDIIKLINELKKADNMENIDNEAAEKYWEKAYDMLGISL